jgi:hypothetical protein
MTRVRINDRWVDVPTSVSEQDLRRAGNISMSRTFLHRQRDGHRLVPRGAVLTVSDGDTFLDAPARVKGA